MMGNPNIYAIIVDYILMRKFVIFDDEGGFMLSQKRGLQRH